MESISELKSVLLNNNVNKITKLSAIEKIILLIEYSDDDNLRVRLIELLRHTNLMRDKIFQVLQDCLIADECSRIKIVVINVLTEIFPKKSYYLLEWVIRYEYSVPVLKEILKKLENVRIVESFEKLLIERISIIHDVCLEESKFFLDLLFQLDDVSEKNHWAEIKITFFSEEKSTSLYDIKCSNSLYHVRNGHVHGLSLKGFRIGILPESIESLSKLEYLNLGCNDLKKLPKSFKNLTNLKELSLYGNKLIEFPDLVYKIAKHYYAKNYIKNGVKLKEASVLGLLEIFMSYKLEKINLIEELDEDLYFFKLNDIGNISGIYIDVSEYLNTPIFKSICSLVNMEELKLSNCNIKEIPDEICQLTSLKILDLECNKISKISRSIFALNNLKYINLDNNRFVAKDLVKFKTFIDKSQ